MYHIDSNINTAIERQADQVRAVQAFGTSQTPAAESRSVLALAAAAATPLIVLAVWGLLIR